MVWSCGICPQPSGQSLFRGFILGQVRRDLSRQAPKNWSIDSIEVELIPQRMAPYSWVLATLEGGYFFTPFTVPQSNYSSLLYGLDEEHDRLMLLDQPNAIIKKLLTVAFTVLSPLLLIVPIALLLWPIASKRGSASILQIPLQLGDGFETSQPSPPT